MTAHAKHKFRLLKWGRMVRDCSWLRTWKRPRVACFEIHGIVTSFPSWIKDAMVVFSRYNIYLVSSNHKKRPTRTERPCVFQSMMCFNVLCPMYLKLPKYRSRTSKIRTSIIRISRLSRLFLWSQFCFQYLLVMIKIHSHIVKPPRTSIRMAWSTRHLVLTVLAFIMNPRDAR